MDEKCLLSELCVQEEAGEEPAWGGPSPFWFLSGQSMDATDPV